MASKGKSIAGLFKAHKRLKLDTETTAASPPRHGLQVHNESTIEGQKKDIQNREAPAANLNVQQQALMNLSSECTITHEIPSTHAPLMKEGLTQEEKMQMELNANISVQESTLISDTHENLNPNGSPSKPLIKEELTQDQKVRMELNKAVANAIRSVKTCEEKVSESRAKGLPFPEFKSILVEQKWSEVLSNEFGKPYMEKLYRFVKEEAGSGFPIYPPPAKVFNAFNTCPFEKVKVVILGQDPYHGPGQAMGLCFSVEKGVKFPSSLLNIFKEIQDDVGCSIPSHGNLEKWSYQGVLLLNAALTVRGGKANSHAKKGWEAFTDAAIQAVATHRSGIVFLLWGNSAQDKTRLINQNSHHILKAAHPSGLSAHRGFFKCRHFSQTNKILEKQGSLPIDWQI